MISPYREDFIFMKLHMRSFAKIKPSRKFPNLQKLWLRYIIFRFSGPEGPSGETGSKGARGRKGPKGSCGAPGKDGIKGYQGLMGPMGPKGDKGIKGRVKSVM